VSLIEPGNFDSEIGRNADNRTGGGNRLADRSRFRKPVEVALAVEQALFEEKPKRRYMVTPVQAEADVTLRKQIEQLVQLNEGHAHTVDRDTLVKMLDEALVNARPKVAAPAAAQ
jgi:predicted RNA-binding Zn ribbon-like protein